jgi:cytosolic carboxypeptidase protein 2/3
MKPLIYSVKEAEFESGLGW